VEEEEEEEEPECGARSQQYSW